MKKLLFLSMLFGLCQSIFAQGVSVNETGTPATSSAILDVSSTSKGMLVPRMTGTQRTMIAAPAEGLLVFDTDAGSFWFYSSGWNEIAGGDGSGNDSLFLPYMATQADPVCLFGITNNSGTNAGSAIMGRRNAGSGLHPGGTVGVWGDNTSGIGVLGTSIGYSGVYGISSQFHGVYGQTDNEGFAGLFGTNTTNGYGVQGLIENDGAAIYGYANGDGGHGGLFRTTSYDHSDTTLLVTTNGYGVPAAFHTANTVTTNPVLDVSQAGNGPGLKVRLHKTTGTSNGVDIRSETSGSALFSKSEKGNAAKFENTNSNNGNPTLMTTNAGSGSNLYINSLHPGLTSNIIDVYTLGTGNALSIGTAKGRCATFVQNDANAVNDAFNVTTFGKGAAAIFTKNNTSGLIGDHQPTVIIESTNMQNALKINSIYSPSQKSALDIDYEGQAYGARISSTGGGLHASSYAQNSYAVLGENLWNGTGVRGTSFAGPNAYAGVKGENTGGGYGVLGTTTGSNAGAGVRGIAESQFGSGLSGVSMQQGFGVFGTVDGDGIGIFGTTGTSHLNGDQGRAAVFVINHPSSVNETTTIEHNGLGTPLLLETSKPGSLASMLKMKSAGQGHFMTCETSAGDEKMFVEKSGNIVTDGTISVRENKGIIRNTYSSQLRVEVVEAFFEEGNPYETFTPNEYRELYVTFNTAFAAPPVVYIGNYMGGVNGNMLATHVRDVTTTGCTLWIQNHTANNISVGDHGWKLVAMGLE